MKKNIGSKIVDIIFIIIALIILYKLYGIYKIYSYGGFTKAEQTQGITRFTRDKDITSGYEYSYKLESKNYNDAMFYKKISVKPNTPYKLSCMVRTENVEAENDAIDSGAQLSVLDTVECSESIQGTNEWQRLYFIFDSKNRNEIEIGFRLGGNNANCKGTAWFSDFKLEEGIKDNSTNWNMVCFIMKNLDVNLDGKNIKLSMSLNDIENMKDNMNRFKESAQELSGNRMTVNYDIYEISTPVTTISYSEEYGYYVDPTDVQNLIMEYLNKEEYDYIFVAIRLGDVNKNINIPIYDWIGLGGMDLLGIGYSNIRLPNDSSNYIYTYNPNINTFPEEVFIHEYLHTLERNLKERDYDIPLLHDNEKYGYTQEKLAGLEKWYGDYMTSSIKTKDGKQVGLDEIVYTTTPPAQSDFKYSIEIEINCEPNNIIEEIKILFQTISRLFISQQEGIK